MKRSSLALLFLTFSLWACSTNISPTGTDSAPPLQINTALSTTKSAPAVSTPHIDQPPNGNEATVTPTYEGCGYQWASKELPDLTFQLDGLIKLFDSGAKARATAFGEDCVYADGHTTFGAMETDFYISKPTSNLTDYEALGTWILNIMQLIVVLPKDMLAGPNPGFVEFAFIKNDPERIIVRVPIQKYKTEATGKSGEELFKMFYTSP